MAKTLIVGRVVDIPDGGAVTVRGPGKQIAIFREGDQVYAIDDMCPHAGASLAMGARRGGVVTCPWHYWRFRLATGRGPTTRGSRSAATRSRSSRARSTSRCRTRPQRTRRRTRLTDRRGGCRLSPRSPRIVGSQRMSP